MATGQLCAGVIGGIAGHRGAGGQGKFGSAGSARKRSAVSACSVSNTAGSSAPLKWRAPGTRMTSAPRRSCQVRRLSSWSAVNGSLSEISTRTQPAAALARVKSSGVLIQGRRESQGRSAVHQLATQSSPASEMPEGSSASARRAAWQPCQSNGRQFPRRSGAAGAAAACYTYQMRWARRFFRGIFNRTRPVAAQPTLWAWE